jgi:hypothetical protein
MPEPTYTALATVTLGSSASSVTFSSIPATYRDLILVFNGTVTGGNGGANMRLNGDTGSNYPFVFMRNVNNTPASEAATESRIPITVSTTTANTRIQSNATIMDYSATDKHKTTLVRSGYTEPTTSTMVEATASRWANTAAVTSLLIYTTANNFSTGSTFSLYGVIA